MEQDLNVLLACFPKSGSTYLSAAIAKTPGMRRARIVPGFDRREQEIDLAKVVQERAFTQRLRELRREGFNGLADTPRGFVAQHHVKFSSVTRNIMASCGLRVIVQTRNLLDALVSLDDHLCTRTRVLPMAWVPEDFGAWPRPRRLDFLILYVAPWYIGFYVSWATRTDVLRCDFSALRDHPAREVRRLMTELGVPLDEDAARTAAWSAANGDTRRNLGVDGRGEAFTSVQRDQIGRMAAFYPDIDFTPIGL